MHLHVADFVEAEYDKQLLFFKNMQKFNKLSRAEMRNVTGGVEAVSDCCCYHTAGDSDYSCGLSQAGAIEQSQYIPNGMWCCDSCHAPAPCEAG